MLKVSFELVSMNDGSSAPQPRRTFLASSIMMSMALGFFCMKPNMLMNSRMVWWLVLPSM